MHPTNTMMATAITAKSANHRFMLLLIRSGVSACSGPGRIFLIAEISAASRSHELPGFDEFTGDFWNRCFRVIINNGFVNLC